MTPALFRDLLVLALSNVLRRRSVRVLAHLRGRRCRTRDVRLGARITSRFIAAPKSRARVVHVSPVPAFRQSPWMPGPNI